MRASCPRLVAVDTTRVQRRGVNASLRHSVAGDVAPTHLVEAVTVYTMVCTIAWMAERRDEKMALPRPTLDQTEGVWIGRTSGQGYHYVQEVFSGDTLIERTHRDNCRLLIERGSLQPEHDNSLTLYQRVWDETKRYCRVHR
jgi:hypothetical protein